MIEQQSESPGATDEVVAIPEASDEELAAFLANSKPEESQEPPQPEGQDKAPETSPIAESANSQDANREQVTPEQYQALLQELERVKAQRQQQEQFIQRRNTEFGELRKQLREQQEKLSKGLDDKFAENPAQAVKDQLAINEINSKLVQLDQQENEERFIQESQEIVKRHVNFEETPLDDMAAMLASDGLATEHVNAFRKDPWRFAQPETLVEMSKRVRAVKENALLKKGVIEVLDAYKKLQAENETLKSSRGKIVERIAQVSKTAPQVTGNSTGTAKVDKLVSANPAEWSQAEIEEFLKNSKR